MQTWGEPNAEKYYGRIEALKKIKDYEYNVTKLPPQKSYEEVTRIFIRVNSAGAKIRNSDLALAQITAKWAGSLEILQSTEKEFLDYKFPIDMSTLLRTLTVYTTGQSKFQAINKTTVSELEEGWNNSVSGLKHSVDFLQKTAKLESPILVSSLSILIVIAKYLEKHKYNLTVEQTDSLKRWVLLANTKGRYSRGSVETVLDQDLAALDSENEIEQLSKNLVTQVGRLKIEPADLEGKNNRSAYFKSMFMAFKQNSADDWIKATEISLDNLGKKHKLEVHHIFPRAVLRRSDVDSKKVNDISNLAFICSETNKKFSDRPPSDYLPGVRSAKGDSTLSKQCIPLTPDLWEVTSFDEFLKQRRELITDRLNIFLGV